MSQQILNSIAYNSNYEYLNHYLYKHDRESFDIGVIVAYICEYEKGYRVKKKNTPNKCGTVFECDSIDNKTQLRKCEIKIKNLIKKYNKKYSKDFEKQFKKKLYEMVDDIQ
ncbi:MAG: hypothetical protein E7E88_15200 [Clostridium perfringens]|uniref:hypothetical protein n=1 Tax=Veillonella sp. TaxID=1926307 RepID=UPI0028FE9EA5|nr:hypothetical protein [Veillonella sp.]MDU2094782.1 hypothetical protein [Clostridium perfringens]MDU2102690.1 hypothetical protein [Veillonella sp.]